MVPKGSLLSNTACHPQNHVMSSVGGTSSDLGSKRSDLGRRAETDRSVPTSNSIEQLRRHAVSLRVETVDTAVDTAVSPKTKRSHHGVAFGEGVPTSLGLGDRPRAPLKRSHEHVAKRGMLFGVHLPPDSCGMVERKEDVTSHGVTLDVTKVEVRRFSLMGSLNARRNMKHCCSQYNGLLGLCPGDPNMPQSSDLCQGVQCWHWQKKKSSSSFNGALSH